MLQEQHGKRNIEAKIIGRTLI